MTSHRALTGRIRQAVQDIDVIVHRVDWLAERARRTGDDGYLDGVALNMHSFYTAVEQVFEVIARDVDGEVPVGTSWHRDLLLQMSAELDGVRPRVITTETRACLETDRYFNRRWRAYHGGEGRANRPLRTAGRW